LPFVESACDHVLFSHTQVEIAARGLHDLVHEPLEDLPPCTIELIGVENLVKHNRASGNLNLANLRAFPVLLVRDHNTVLANALPCFDTALESISPDVRENISVPLEVRVDRLEVAETRVAHDYFFLKMKIGSYL
jgi:hypothetical protein